MTEKYFSLVKTVSLLDISDCMNQSNDTREFWKLNPSPEDVGRASVSSGLDSTECLLGAYRKKIQELTLSAQRLLKSENSKVNSPAEPVHRISLSHNLTRVNDSTLPDALDDGKFMDLMRKY